MYRVSFRRYKRAIRSIRSNKRNKPTNDQQCAMPRRCEGVYANQGNYSRAHHVQEEPLVDSFDLVRRMRPRNAESSSQRSNQTNERSRGGDTRVVADAPARSAAHTHAAPRIPRRKLLALDLVPVYECFASPAIESSLSSTPSYFWCARLLREGAILMVVNLCVCCVSRYHAHTKRRESKQMRFRLSCSSTKPPSAYNRIMQTRKSFPCFAARVRNSPQELSPSFPLSPTPSHINESQGASLIRISLHTPSTK